MKKDVLTICVPSDSNTIEISEKAIPNYHEIIRCYGSFQDTLDMISTASGSGNSLAGEPDVGFIPKNVARALRKEFRRRKKGYPKRRLVFNCEYIPLDSETIFKWVGLC